MQAMDSSFLAPAEALKFADDAASKGRTPAEHLKCLLFTTEPPALPQRTIEQARGELEAMVKGLLDRVAKSSDPLIAQAAAEMRLRVFPRVGKGVVS